MKRVDTPADLYEAIEIHRESVIAMWRGLEYDMSDYPPITIRSHQTLRSIDGGSNTAIISDYGCLPDKSVVDQPYEETLRLEPGAKLQGITLKGLSVEDADAGMIQCAVRILGQGVTLNNVRLVNWLKWGVDALVLKGHKFTDCTWTNILYNDPHGQIGIRGGGYGYGVWGRGTEDGKPPAESDITEFIGCVWDNCRNAFDCSQAGNSAKFNSCLFGYCLQSAVDMHRAYGMHDLDISLCTFTSDDSPSYTRLHKVTGKASITDSVFAGGTKSVYINRGNLPCEPWDELDKVSPVIETDQLTIKGNTFRYSNIL